MRCRCKKEPSDLFHFSSGQM